MMLAATPRPFPAPNDGINEGGGMSEAILPIPESAGGSTLLSSSMRILGGAIAAPAVRFAISS